MVLCSFIYMNPDSLHLSRQRAYPTEQSGSSQSSLPSYHPRRHPWCASKNRNSGFILTRCSRNPPIFPKMLLLPDSRNLALVLNQIEHKDGRQFNQLLKRFCAPVLSRMSTRVSGGTVQFYLHEPGFTSPVPATRLSDGTIRFVAILATLLSPTSPPLVCIEEPELGLHPDAVALIAELLIEASNRMQLVVTTHSDLNGGAGFSPHPAHQSTGCYHCLRKTRCRNRTSSIGTGRTPAQLPQGALQPLR